MLAVSFRSESNGPLRQEKRPRRLLTRQIIKQHVFYISALLDHVTCFPAKRFGQTRRSRARRGARRFRTVEAKASSGGAQRQRRPDLRPQTPADSPRRPCGHPDDAAAIKKRTFRSRKGSLCRNCLPCGPARQAAVARSARSSEPAFARRPLSRCAATLLAMMFARQPARQKSGQAVIRSSLGDGSRST